MDVKHPGDIQRKRYGTVVDMGRAEPRFVEKLNKDPFYDDQPINELNNDVLKAL